MSSVLEFFVFIIVCFLGVLIPIFIKEITGYYENEHIGRLTEDLKKESKQSIDELTHQHSAHWEYIKELIPWRIRLRLSRFRGKKRALRWRIKVLAFFSGIGPQVAEWILEEYMITAKTEERPTSNNNWICAKCGTYNPDTALFCENCGAYK